MTAFVPIRVAENSGILPEQKETSLLARLSEAGSTIVALCGGADSAYLAWAAQRALGERALSVTALSPSFSAHDRAAVDQLVREFQIHHEFIETHEVENPPHPATAAHRRRPLFLLQGRAFFRARCNRARTRLHRHRLRSQRRRHAGLPPRPSRRNRTSRAGAATRRRLASSGN